MFKKKLAPYVQLESLAKLEASSPPRFPSPFQFSNLHLSPVSQSESWFLEEREALKALKALKADSLSLSALPCHSHLPHPHPPLSTRYSPRRVPSSWLGPRQEHGCRVSSDEYSQTFWEFVLNSDEFGSGDSGIKCFCMATFVSIAQ